MFVRPALEKAGWNPSSMRMEYYFTDGRIIVDPDRAVRSTERKKADYILFGKGGDGLAVVEAKDGSHTVSDGIQQAIDYARILQVPFVYSTNGTGFCEYDMTTGKFSDLPMTDFPSPGDLWRRFIEYKKIDEASALAQPYYFKIGGYQPRYYQACAIKNVVEAYEKGQKRMMIVLATGTGKTFVAMQIMHKLLEARKANHILFLTDRNVLVNQPMSKDFSHFGSRMTKVQKRTLNSAFNIHLALYQQLVGDSGKEDTFKQFTPDFFDLIIVDECHRGGVRENSEWHRILEYFSPAAQLGMTATPKEDSEEFSTSRYFGAPLYTYSYRQGVEDGFLAPFRLKSMEINIDDFWYPEDGVTDQNGNPLLGPYDKFDYDRKVVVDKRTMLVAQNIIENLNDSDPMSKTIVFCVDTEHAQRMALALAYYAPEQMKKDPRYVMRLTGNDEEGAKQVENFADKNSLYPVIATTSELLSTGVDTVMAKFIAIDRNIGSQSEFKQILGRGSRLNTDGNKWFFTLLDYRGVSAHFSDEEWDGVPLPFDSVEENEDPGHNGGNGNGTPPDMPVGPGKIHVRGDVSVFITTEIDRVYGADGELTTENIKDYSRGKMLGEYPNLFDFLNKWYSVDRKAAVLKELEEKGVLITELRYRMGHPEWSDFDLVLNVAYNRKPLTRTERADSVRKDPELDKYTGRCREIIDALITNFSSSNASDMDDFNVLRLEEFQKYGSVSRIVREFGGKDEYLAVVRKIENKFYGEV